MVKALILNSGIGRRMGVLASEHPKCMTEISTNDTILSRQLRQLVEAGLTEVVITTGAFDDVLINYCRSLELPIHFSFVKNPLYKETNYIYSIFCARKYIDDDIVLMHGDLVFENEVLDKVIGTKESCMVVSSTQALSEKDFKAVIQNKIISKIGIEFFNEAMTAQPLYKLNYNDWKGWLNSIIAFCESGNTKCYAENAFNEVSDQCRIIPLDIKNLLCNEIDNPEDLAVVSARVRELENRIVYMCFSTDILHSGHIAIIKKAKKLGRLIIGVLSDEAVVSYKRFPLLPYAERKNLFENISGIYKVVEQRTLSYKENLEKFQPAYVVHGDDWTYGFQRAVRDEVVSVLASYGGRLVEFPYSKDEKYRELEKRAHKELAVPELRRGRLRKAIAMKSTISAIEAHNGITGLIAEDTIVGQEGKLYQFDAIWISSLCDSTAKGKPDIELVDMTSRYRTVDDIMEVTTKPIIFDGDTGGLEEHFVYTVRTLERMGVSMVIIEDKIGLKRNSLFGAEANQKQASIPDFCAKIKAGKQAQKTKEFMICARIESLILEKGMDDALERAFCYIKAGADAIMIHSRKKEPDEIFEFLKKFREKDSETAVVVVPTSFNTVTENEFMERGVNVVIYANQLTRAGIPAMQNAARMILKNHRAKECDQICMPFQDIIRLIPEDM